MKALLVRVGADRSAGGGSWNGPVDGESGEFAYVAIPETSRVHIGMEKPYSSLAPILARFRVDLPAHLRLQHMHLDPDLQHLTYGDQLERAKTGGPAPSFMRLAGSIRRPRDLSSRKGFSRS